MPDLKPDENFEPSRDSKMLWRFTKKGATTYAGITLPGLFHTSNMLWYGVTFFLVVVLEAWGLYNLLVVGEANLIYVLCLFLMDMALAVFRHLPFGEICESRNRLIIESNSDMQASIRGHIGKLSIIIHVCSFLIWIVAAFKTVTFFALQNTGFNGLTMGIMVSYFVVAFIHVSVTGFVLFNILFEIRWWLDRRKFESVSSDTVRRHAVESCRWHPFCGPASIHEFQVDRHELVADQESAEDVISNGNGKERRYVFRTWGLLTDAQLQAFINRQPNEITRAIVAREGLRHQVVDILQGH